MTLTGQGKWPQSVSLILRKERSPPIFHVRGTKYARGKLASFWTGLPEFPRCTVRVTLVVSKTMAVVIEFPTQIYAVNLIYTMQTKFTR